MRREKEDPSIDGHRAFFPAWVSGLIRATPSIDERGASDVHCPVRQAARRAGQTAAPWMDG